MDYKKRLGMLWATAMLCVQTALAQGTPEVGWWWNPDESGRGFFVESQNGIMYVAGYLYDADGRAMWVAAGGPNADPNSFNGRLLAPEGGQTLFGDYKAPTASSDVGEVSVRFTDDKHGTITWPGGTIPIQRNIFDSRTAIFQPHSGWWWNPAESGRGFTLEVQGESLVVAGFMYADNGKPVWYYSAGKMSSPTTYQGAWLQFADGQTMTGPYHPPTAPLIVGHLQVQFTATDEATLTITDDAVQAAGAVHGKASRFKMIVLEPTFAAKPKLPAYSYDGHFSYTVQRDDAFSHTTWTVEGHLTWSDADSDNLPLAPRGNFPGKIAKTYQVLTGVVTATYQSSVSSDGATCNGFGTATTNIGPGDGSWLEVSGYAEYVGNITKNVNDIDVRMRCTAFGNTVDKTSRQNFRVDLPIKGTVLGGITGTLPATHLGENLYVTADWSFLAVH